MFCSTAAYTAFVNSFNPWTSATYTAFDTIFNRQSLFSAKVELGST